MAGHLLPAGGAAFMVPSKSRPEIVARIKAIEVGRTTRGGPKYLTNEEVAETVGVTERQVKRDLSDDRSGQMTPFADNADDEVIDAEIVGDDTPKVTDPAPLSGLLVLRSERLLPSCQRLACPPDKSLRLSARASGKSTRTGRQVFSH